MGRSERGGLFVYSKQRQAHEDRIESGLRHELGVPNIPWITMDGGLPRGIKVADRADMIERLIK
jgi:hypothetical protein